MGKKNYFERIKQDPSKEYNYTERNKVKIRMLAVLLAVGYIIYIVYDLFSQYFKGEGGPDIKILASISAVILVCAFTALAYFLKIYPEELEKTEIKTEESEDMSLKKEEDMQ